MGACKESTWLVCSEGRKKKRKRKEKRKEID
jgi:hypothetical protein